MTNKHSLQLEALWNCDNFTVITILYNNDVLTWDYKNNKQNIKILNIKILKQANSKQKI